MRAILPTAFNDLIMLAKGTSMVYVLAMPELFYTVQVIYRRNLEVIPLLMVATVWYLIILTVLSAIQVQVERHYARGRCATRRRPSSRSRSRASACCGGVSRPVTRHRSHRLTAIATRRPPSHRAPAAKWPCMACRSSSACSACSTTCRSSRRAAA